MTYYTIALFLILQKKKKAKTKTKKPTQTKYDFRTTLSKQRNKPGEG